MYGAPWRWRRCFASRGIATIAINVVGHGGGHSARWAVLRTNGGPVVVRPAAAASIRMERHDRFDRRWLCSPAAHPHRQPRRPAPDGDRPDAAVREIEVGVDVDGDGAADLNGSRIYYAGQSFGGIYGTILLGVESNIQAGVPNVAGGSVTKVARLGAFRPLVGIALATHIPS